MKLYKLLHNITVTDLLRLSQLPHPINFWGSPVPSFLFFTCIKIWKSPIKSGHISSNSSYLWFTLEIYNVYIKRNPFTVSVSAQWTFSFNSWEITGHLDRNIFGSRSLEGITAFLKEVKYLSEHVFWFSYTNSEYYARNIVQFY